MPRRKYREMVPRKSQGAYVAEYEKQSMHRHELPQHCQGPEIDKRVLKHLNRISQKRNGTNFATSVAANLKTDQ